MTDIEGSIYRDNMEYYREIVKHIREYVKVMEDEPAEQLILQRRVYNDLRRMLGDE